MRGLATAATALAFGAGIVACAFKAPQMIMLPCMFGAMAVIFVGLLEFHRK